MEQEKLYIIEEKSYEAHIDEKVHLYGLLYQLASSNPISHLWRKKRLQKQYADAYRVAGKTAQAGKTAEATAKAAKKTAQESKRTALF